MIERQFFARKIKEYQIEEFVSNNLDKAGYSHTEILRTPLGERIIIYTSRPSLIVGRKGSNIKDLTEILKKKFGMENPQVEVSEVDTPNLNAKSVAKHIVHTFERFGPKRFKSIGYKALQDIMDAGALGAEIVISGRGVPSSRAKSWRFKTGYLKKSGYIAESLVKKGYATAHLKSGSIGVKVTILTPDIRLPDKITIKNIQEKIQPKPTDINQESSQEQKEQKAPQKEQNIKQNVKTKRKTKDGDYKEH